jgi:hypothetical protein
MHEKPLAMLARFTGSVALVALAACSSGSRLWRLSPFSDAEESQAERANLWPVAWFDGNGGSLLWPLVDFDHHGFAVRPLVSRDDDDLDVLFPLSHFDTGTGEGWALNAYSFGGNRGVFPIANVSRDGFSWAGPVYWKSGGAADGSGSGYRGLFLLSHMDDDGFSWAGPVYWSHDANGGGCSGVFPIAHVNETFGFVGPAWWRRDSDRYGLFPLFTHADLSWYGPFWWNREGLETTSYGLFPLATKGETSWIGPAWWHAPNGGATDAWGLFPLVWSEQDEKSESLTILPLYHGGSDANGSRHALLLPPTWWETTPTLQRRFVLPFYGHVEDEAGSLTFAVPLFAKRTHGDESHVFTLLGDAWRTGEPDGATGVRASGLNVYPLYWSARSGERSRQMLVPFWYYREQGDERLVLTPFGGRGWDASGGSGFTNVLGPVYHHSEGTVEGVPVESTAVAWPLFEWSRSGDTTTTRALPFFGVESTPTTTDSWQLAGLGRYVADEKSASYRAFPFYAQSNAAETPDPLFDFTLAGSWSHGGEYSRHVFPLWSSSGDAKCSEQTALLGLGRYATTEGGSAWRLWPLASGSTDARADGLLDEFTLIRTTRGEDGDGSQRFFPLYWGGRSGGTSKHVALLGIARVKRSEEGSAWRLWPLVSTTDADGLDDWLDPLTFVGVHPHFGKTHVHVGTSLLFDLDRFGEEKRSWNLRTLTLFDVGHVEEHPADPAALPNRWTERRDYAGFLFDWFLVEHSTIAERDGARHDGAHYRLPLVHEYERTAHGTDWDVLCYTVSRERTESTDKLHVLGGYAFQKESTPSGESVHVLGYAYRSDKKGDTTRRDIFPAVTWDTEPDGCRLSFLWKLFVYDRKGDKRGGNFLFIPWGERTDEARVATEKHS